ncbi:hypothetical protein [Methyloterricola oryzae]|uniref:hypothetical protein n=1 Tax=Methyloterricola oryzae TaxID=1495050 RepID=UPI0005EB1579|nr:hypothetical protein [Methyloterricola oryzae]
MTEILAALTVAFAGYVLYEVFKTVSQPGSDSQSHFQAAPPKDTPEVASVPTPAEPAISASAPASATSPEPAAAEEKTITLRNPSTGETCPIPTNYRFAKKWVKEALVAEGLLKKVYKNSELTEAVSPKVKEALEKLRNLEKYHA